MEKSILKTLIYADIFDYPLKAWEVHKWVINNNVDLLQTEKVLNKLSRKSLVTSHKGYFFLPNRKGLVAKRMNRQKHSKYLFKKAQLVANIFRIIPWIKLVGISGGLAMENAGEKDDIDLFVITGKNRLWISRILMLGIVSCVGLRRRSTDKKQSAAGKICLNLILEEDALLQKKKNIYMAHEVLQMKPLWQKGEVYSRYLEENEWVFKFLPNWKSVMSFPRKRESTKLLLTGSRVTHGMTKGSSHYRSNNNFLDFLNNQAYQFQIQNMNKPKGEEKISKGAVYFHPKDYGIEVLSNFKKLVS